MKTLIAIFLAFNYFFINAQPGKSDTTFNSIPYSKYGTGNGSNGCPYTNVTNRKFCEQPDGKIILAGGFCQFNGVVHSGVVRLNVDGSLDDSFDAGTTFEYNVGNYSFTALALQNDGKVIAIRTEFDGVNISRIRRLNIDGSLDAAPVFQGDILQGIIYEAIVQPDNKLILCGDFTYEDTDLSMHYDIIRINPDGSLDNTFTGGDFVLMQNGKIEDMKLDAQGKLLIAGGFNTFNGVNSAGFVRLNPDGTIDQTLNIGAGMNDAVKSFAIQPDNKILLAGDFGLYQNMNTGCLIRIHPDGTLDGTFQPSMGTYWPVEHLNVLPDNRILFTGNSTSLGVNHGFFRLNSDGSLDTATTGSEVYNSGNPPYTEFKFLSSGKLMIIGNIYQYQGKYRGGIARLDTNFLLDLSFGMKPGFISADIQHTLAQPDGKILVGKRLDYEADALHTYNDVFVKGLLRLQADGSLDTTFHIADSLFVSVRAMARQPDGKIIVAGRTEWLDGIDISSQGNVARFNPDGSIDSSFLIYNFTMYSFSEVLIQPDGKIIVLGYFTPISGNSLTNIVRFNTDGTPDNTFNAGTGTNGEITSGALTNSGKIIIGGDFNSYNGLPFVRFCALNSDGSIDAGFDFNGSIFSAPWSIKTQSDGKILLAGETLGDDNNFSRVLLRLNPNGNVDPNFEVNGFQNVNVSGEIMDMLPLPNGKLLLGGEIYNFSNSTATGIVRLNADGSRDMGFFSEYIVSEPSVLVKSISLGLDGKVIIGGDFSKITGKPANGIALLQHDLADYFTVSFTNVVNDNCSGNGAVTAFPIGGTPPYQYSWQNLNNPSDSVQVITEQGIYTCFVQDATGLISSASLLIDGPSFLSDFDLKSNLVAGSFRTGFSNTIAINAMNDGCMPASGQLICVLDSLVEYNSAIPLPTFQNNDTLIWDFMNMTYDTGFLNPVIQCTVSSDAQIGDSVTVHLSLTPISGDADTVNNSKSYRFPVINGYDPNIKSVYPVGKCEEAYIKNSQKLTYTVQFQNTGNASAINIVVVDSLNDNLDINSVHVVSYSDTVWTEIAENNTVKFHFDLINLPDSTSNEAASHGYVTFEVDPISDNLPHNTVISNEAEIYFDYNPAIVTNSCLNTIFVGDLDQFDCNSGNLVLEELANENEITVFPNPIGETLTIQFDQLGDYSVHLVDLTGRFIFQTEIQSQKVIQINGLDDLSRGEYILFIANETGVTVRKLIK